MTSLSSTSRTETFRSASEGVAGVPGAGEYQQARKNGNGNLVGAGVAAADSGAPIIINSNSTAVGNWQQIEMTLGEGAEGLIMTENH